MSEINAAPMLPRSYIRKIEDSVIPLITAKAIKPMIDALADLNLAPFEANFITNAISAIKKANIPNRVPNTKFKINELCDA